jgi:colicin import membrane protein
MLPDKIRLLSLTAVAVVAWLVLSSGHSPTVGQEPVIAQDHGAKIKGLQKEWLDALRAMAKEEQARVKNAQALPEEVIAATRLLAEAELEACESDKDRVTALEKILVMARDTEKLAVSFAKSGQGREGTALKAKAERLRFEIALERAKTKAAAKPADGDASQGFRRGQVALAEKQAAIKQAAVKIAEAQKAKAQASLANVKAQVAQAKAAESYAEMQLHRFSDLFKAQAIEERVLDEQRAKLEAAKAKRIAAEAQVAETESQVAVEQAKIAQAQLEFEEAQLKLEQLKARLQSR